MLCPVCDGATKIVDSRKDVDCVTRRRECIVCKYRFTTVEIDRDMYRKMIGKGDSDDK